MKIKDLKAGTYFTKKQIDFPTAKQVWVRGSYDRSTKKYCCFNYDDVCKECFVPGDKEVFTEFYF